MLAEAGDDPDDPCWTPPAHRPRPDQGERHAALRNLYNRLLGCLFHCLTTRRGSSPSLSIHTLKNGSS